MRSAASSDSIPLHEITGFLSVEKDDHPRHCARTNENAKSRRTKRVSRSQRDVGKRVADFVGGAIWAGGIAGVGLKKKADHYPLVLSASVARFLMHLVCDAL